MSTLNLSHLNLPSLPFTLRSMRFLLTISFVVLLSFDLPVGSRLAAQEQRVERVSDPRNIKNGWVIPDEGYSDQPYVVTTNDGKWLCLMTTGKGVEGEGGQHVVATISGDYGRHWSELIDIEPATGPEASWVMP